MVEKIRERDRFAQLIGAEIVSAGEGRGEVKLSVGPQHLNAMDVVQGGVIFTIADLAFALACNSQGVPAVGLSVNIHYLRPGRSGVLTARAREVSLSNRVGDYVVEVTDEAGEVLAVFHGLAYRKLAAS